MERRAVVVSGTVQGVGFRPFVHTLARGLALNGFVRNVAGDVQIEIEGPATHLDQFMRALVADAPALTRIQRVENQPMAVRGEAGFRIETSELDTSGQVVVTFDTATCEQCLAELFDPGDRRYLYPFLNCTNCGPRLTIITGAPYDRERTTMRSFVLCDACQAEYDDLENRRFHAQPIACPRCGPQLQLSDVHGATIATNGAINEFVVSLRAGQIGALKGLGGYHLVCDATNADAVATLRCRKQRDDKPFAIMVSSVELAARYCEITSNEQELLTSHRRPIVLLRKRTPHGAIETGGQLAPSIAPGNRYLAVMLPYTPLHHLLLRAVGDIPLVMTSGNRSDEPIACREPDAFEQLHGIADLFLTHNREIHVRCDDSVTQIIGDAESIVRRSRGYAPEPLRLPVATPLPLLAVGGQLKGTFALLQDRQATISHHLGDLDHAEAYRAFTNDVNLYEQLFAVRPKAIVCDLHPDYTTTYYARKRAATDALPLIAVQHHHAHVASCMAEHGLTEPVIGVAFDGTGWGPDGAIWGGEFLLANYAEYSRAAHLRYVPLPGGDRAARDTWRMALAYLLDAGCDARDMAQWTTADGVNVVQQMIARQVNCPLTSSVGRLFDAVAAIIGVRGVVTFEAQAAMELESLASDVRPDGGYPFAVAGGATSDARLEVDLRPTIRALVDEKRRGVEQPRVARRFHTTVVEIIATICARLRRDYGRQIVVLSGGVFANRLIVEESAARLQGDGFRVYRHTRVPTNDGGLSLGQLAVGAARLSEASTYKSTTRIHSAREMLTPSTTPPEHMQFESL